MEGSPREGVSLAEQQAARRALDEGHEIGRGGTGFVGRMTELGVLNAWMSATDSPGRWLAITGAPGSGKSALLGEFHRRLEERDHNGEPLVDGTEDLLADLVDTVGTAVEQVYSWYVDNYPSRWRGFPEFVRRRLDQRVGDRGNR
ncbi:hypothetical protein [Streptomyces sp. NPDC050535]|uniref:hypothetical protein n=1 Tax=Streptomyces sp. NPDC050535 TaxID=3365626 RepID=UPI00378CB8C2